MNIRKYRKRDFKNTTTNKTLKGISCSNFQSSVVGYFAPHVYVYNNGKSTIIY